MEHLEIVSTSANPDYIQHYPLFDFQLNAIKAIREQLGEVSRAGILALPTGAGKTKVAVWWALQDHVAKHRRIVWMVARDEP